LKIAIMQPTCFPWIGYFEELDFVDTFVFLDSVQLARRSWQTRNRLKLNGKEYMFTIPVKKIAARDEIMLNDALISFEHYDFREKLYDILRQAYKKAPFYQNVDPFLKDLIFYDTKYLSKYHINMISNISKKIGINTEIVILSESAFVSDKKKSELLLDICKFFGATEYVSPQGAKNYLENDRKIFEDENISIIYQNYQHPVYPQLGNDFLPYMGVIDLLYNVGFDESLDIIRKGRLYEDR